MIQLAGGQYCIPSGNPIVREKYAPNRGSAAHFCTTLHRIDMLQRQKTHQTQTFAALQQGINVVFAHKSHATRCKTSCKVDFLAHSPLKKAAIRTGKTRGMLGQPHMLSSTSTQSHQAPTATHSHSTELAWRLLPASTLKTDASLARDWNRLNVATSNQPFLDADAVADALAIFGGAHEHLALAYAGQTLAAMLVISKTAPFRWCTFQPSQLPLGAWVIAPGFDLALITRTLLPALPGFALTLSITQADPRFTPRPADTPTLHTDDYIDTGWLELVGSFESYWHERSKNLRHNLRKQRHKLADQGVHISLREVTAPEDMAAAVARYGALESAGWKAGIGTAVHPDNEQGRFYRQLLEKSARAGEALVCEYWFDDRMVASNLCQLRGDTLVVLKTTYDEGCKHVSPAFLLREAELQSFFETGRIRRLEFYGRLRPWHTHWTEHRRTLYHTTAYRTSWIRQLARLRQASRHDQTATPLTP